VLLPLAMGLGSSSNASEISPVLLPLLPLLLLLLPPLFPLLPTGLASVLWRGEVLRRRKNFAILSRVLENTIQRRDLALC